MSATSLLVVVPVRGDDGTLARALASVGDAADVVVVDDGSDPPVAASAPVPIVRIEPSGVSAARNRGAAAAPGDVLVFLDADDELLPGWAERLVAPFASGDVAAVCGGAEIVGRDGSTSARRPAPMGPAFDDIGGLFLAGTFAIRRSAFDAVGGYDEELAFSENTELALRLAEWCRTSGSRVVPVDGAVVRVHQRDQHERRARYGEARVGAVERLFERHGAALARDPRLRADYARVAGAAAAHLGRFGDARRWFLRSGRAPADLARAALTLVPALRERAWGTRG